jgi:4'-phosphopantetheinyl transferase
MTEENPQTSALLWRSPPATLALEEGAVHVWRAGLDLERPSIERLARTLSQDERARADRFHFEKDRDRFIASHGFLRSILGHYLGIMPGDLEFVYGAYGKPALGGRFAVHEILFNMSHAEAVGLYAFARRREVGIDVEHRRADFATRAVAEKFFSPREAAMLFELPEHLRSQAFFNCWTRKEAYIKARGTGLSLPLDQFDVSLLPGEPAKLLHTSGDPTEASRWCLQELNPGPGYAAALAVAGDGFQLSCWQWP